MSTIQHGGIRCGQVCAVAEVQSHILAVFSVVFSTQEPESEKSAIENYSLPLSFGSRFMFKVRAKLYQDG